jgi:hypothetical protein
MRIVALIFLEVFLSKENCDLLSLFDTMLNFLENLLENERGPMNDQDLTKTDYDPDRSLVLIEGLSHFLTNFLQNLASCQTSFTWFFSR